MTAKKTSKKTASKKPQTKEEPEQEQVQDLAPIKANSTKTAILQVARGLAQVGISKSKKNKQQGWSFRGIDDLYNTMSPLLVEAGLFIIPSVLDVEHEVIPRGNKSPMMACRTTIRFVFQSVHDDEQIVASFCGEGLDASDKSTAQAATAAYKYMLFQVFCIPLETQGSPDGDFHSPERPPAGSKPDQTKEQSEAEAKRLQGFLDEIGEAASMAQLNAVSRKIAKHYGTGNAPKILGRAWAGQRDQIKPAEGAE